MAVRMGLIYKKPDWSLAAFDAYWRDQHGALARHAPDLREYWQNPVVDKLQRGIAFARGSWEVDGFSQLSFDDGKQPDQLFRHSDFAAQLIRDEQYFLADLHIVTAEQTEVIPIPAANARAKLLKRMSIITRLPSMTEADFRREWAVHAEFVRQMAGVSAYRQNWVVSRERVKGHRCGHDALPIDGIVEMWFKDTAALEAAFNSEAGLRTMAHAQSFLSEITAFVVQERRVF